MVCMGHIYLTLRGVLQVPTQGIAQWVERWSFVSMGEDME